MSASKDHCLTAANLLVIRLAPNTSVTSRGRFSTQEAEPVTSTFGWATFVGSLHRVFFALFMGLPALLLLVLLWTLSVPLMAANLVVWFKKVRSTLRAINMHSSWLQCRTNTTGNVEGSRILPWSTVEHGIHATYLCNALSHAWGFSSSRRNIHQGAAGAPTLQTPDRNHLHRGQSAVCER